ncbi:MAG: metal ABC transporter ATP-binding protein [Planctomycetota bacterium]|jgi:manganese/zinc/iron transport system ATP- binding protein
MSGDALEFHDLTVAYHIRPVLWDVDLAVPEGRLAAIIGPNGAGKSTLLKAALDLVPLASGYVRVFQRPYREVRRRVAYVPQRESVDWDFPASVADVVLMGRYGKAGWFRRPSRKDRRLAHEALERVGMAEYADRQISRLSGGQQQRTFLARALAQDADLYVMDEPFAGVDAVTERAIVALLRELRDQGRTVLCVQHDLQTVPEYFDWVALLNMRLVACGAIAETFTHENLHRTYGGHSAILERAATTLLQGRKGR